MVGQLTQMIVSVLAAVAAVASPLQPAQAQTADSPIHYLSPSGSDDNDGSRSSPWRTFDHAFTRMQAGDTLILKDGTYRPSTTGLLIIDCGSDGLDGEPGARITVRAENERRARLVSNGTVAPVRLEGCNHWDIIGLAATNRDRRGFDQADEGSVFYLNQVDKVRLRRNIAFRNNRYGNSHLFDILASTRVLLVENEGYFFHRHGISVNQSTQVVTRRNYLNSRRYHDLPNGYPSHGNARDEGDEGLTFYTWTSDSISENDIVVHSEGFQTRGQNNKFFGDIAIKGYAGVTILTKFTCEDPACYATGARIKNLLAVESKIGVRFLDAEDTAGTNITIVRAERLAFEGHKLAVTHPEIWDFPGLFTSFDLADTLAFDGDGRGFVEIGMDRWRGESINSFNNATDFEPSAGDANGQWINARSVDPALRGCLVYIPSDSPMKGAGRDGGDIGANILYRYRNGKLTETPLWDPVTGAFPCGAIVPGLNDVPGESCFDVHERLNVNTAECPLPTDYPQSARF